MSVVILPINLQRDFKKKEAGPPQGPIKLEWQKSILFPLVEQIDSSGVSKRFQRKADTKLQWEQIM